MHIAILGYGAMGSALAKQFAASGHSVLVGVRSPEKYQDGPVGVRIVSLSAAARSASVVVLATPHAAAAEILRDAGAAEGAFAQKVLIDITNPLTPDYQGLTIGRTDSGAEQIARLLPDTRVVKAFNTVFAQVLAQGPVFGAVHAQVFYAGDDTEANRIVHTLIADLGFVSTPISYRRPTGNLCSVLRHSQVLGKMSL